MTIEEIQITYREMNEEDIKKVFNMVKSSFDEFVAPGYLQEGVDEFMKYAECENLSKRMKTGYITLIAEVDDNIIGMIEIRGAEHISLFFVDKDYKGKGIGRKLFKLGMDKCMKLNPGLKSMTVNSSPYAVEIYKKLGFEQVKPEKEIHGIRFIHMVSKINAEQLQQG